MAQHWLLQRTIASQQQYTGSPRLAGLVYTSVFQILWRFNVIMWSNGITGENRVLKIWFVLDDHDHGHWPLRSWYDEPLKISRGMAPGFWVPGPRFWNAQEQYCSWIFRWILPRIICNTCNDALEFCQDAHELSLAKNLYLRGLNSA